MKEKIKLYLEIKSKYNSRLRKLMNKFNNWDLFYKQIIPVLSKLGSLLEERKLLRKDFISMVGKTIEAAFIDFAEKKQVNNRRYIIKGDNIIIYSPNSGRKWIIAQTTDRPTLFDMRIYLSLMPNRKITLFGMERSIDNYLEWIRDGIPKGTVLTTLKSEAAFLERPLVRIKLPMKKVFPIDKNRFITLTKLKGVDIEFLKEDKE